MKLCLVVELTYSPEKGWSSSVGMMKFPIYGQIIHLCSKNHQPELNSLNSLAPDSLTVIFWKVMGDTSPNRFRVYPGSLSPTASVSRRRRDGSCGICGTLSGGFFVIQLNDSPVFSGRKCPENVTDLQCHMGLSENVGLIFPMK